MLYKRSKNFFTNLLSFAHNQKGNLSLICALDILWCRIYYGLAPIEYDSFGFLNLKWNVYKTYFTQRHNESLINRSNKNKHLFQDKLKLYSRLKNLFGRSVIPLANATEEDILTFIRSHNGAILKPRYSKQGKSIKKSE